MDQAKFDEAKKAYDARNYRDAAKGFLSSVGRGSEGNGPAYHYAGNSLMRLRRWRDAVTVYGHALRDQAYTRRGAVYSNLGQAYAQLGEYPHALDAYGKALEESDFRTPHKAHQGMAAALLEMGRVEEAAVEYRKAALEAENPDPGKALNNLGLCFMALGRPEDAVESYKAALGFDNYKGRGRALSNLGQAYYALGLYGDAVAAFEKATEFHGYQLGDSARADYEKASAATVAPAREFVEGGEPDAMPTAAPGADVDTGAASAEADAEEAGGGISTADAEQAAAQLGMGDDEAINRFFSRTEEEMREADREARKSARAQRETRRWAPRAALIAVGALLLVALIGGAYALGIGWPTQGSTVRGLLSAHASGDAVDRYWVAVPVKDLGKEMAKLPPSKSYRLDSVERGSSVSIAKVTVTPKDGAPQHYKITLAREGVGWRVTGVDNDWEAGGGK